MYSIYDDHLYPYYVIHMIILYIIFLLIYNIPIIIYLYSTHIDDSAGYV